MAAALVLLVLPLLALAPVLAGSLLVHDHGDGVHAHRRELADSKRDPASGHHHHHHHHDHDHDQPHARAGDPEAGPESGAGDAPVPGPMPVESEEEAPRRGLVLLFPRLTLVQVPVGVTAPAPVAVPQPWFEPPLDLVASRVAPSVRRSRLTWRAPPGRAVEALLLGSHAILV